MAEKITKKVKHVLELSKFKVGQRLYWVNFTPLEDKEIDVKPEDEWIYAYHPKAFFDRGYMTWPHGKLPALHAKDFATLLEVMSYKVVVEPFVVKTRTRSLDTGEFLYQNSGSEWMTESMLFSNPKHANAERNRIVKLIKAWARKLV